MQLNLSEEIPQEGAIGIGPIIELMREFCDTPLDQSSISGAQITETPLYKLLTSIISGKNDENNPLKSYLLEHNGHFILLDLKQTKTGVEYAIYDSLAHSQNGEIRKKIIEDILRNTFFNAVITQNQGQYIKIEQGENPHNIPDTDNCGLTAVFAQFIYEQFGENFPRDIFIQNPDLYAKLNAIAQSLRGHQVINIDKIMEELTALTLEIVNPQEEVQQAVESGQPFDISQEIQYLAQIDKKYSDDQEMELPYDLTLQFHNFLSQAIKNKGQINENNLNIIAHLYKNIVKVFLEQEEKFLSNLHEEFSKKALDKSYSSDKLTEHVAFSQNLVNTLYFFHELKKLFSHSLPEDHQDLLDPLGIYNPVLRLAKLVVNISATEIGAVGDRIDINILDNFDKALELALRLAKENKESYKKSDKEDIKTIIARLNNQLLHYRATRCFQDSGPNAQVDQRKMAQAYTQYTTNAGEDERNDHNFMGLMADYATNNNKESLRKFKSILVSIEDESRKSQCLKLTIEVFLREASRRSRNFTEEALDRFRIIYQLLTDKNLSHFVDQDPELKFALIFAKQSLYTEKQIKEYKVSDEEILSINLNYLSGIYSELYPSSISLTQDLERSARAVMDHLDLGVAPHRPTQEVVDLYNLQAAYGFRDYFVYNKACSQHLFTDQAFITSIKIHEKALEKSQTPRFTLGLLISLFKLQFLSADNASSESTIRKIATLIQKNEDLAKKVKLPIYLKYLKKSQDNPDLDIEQRLELIKKIDLYIGALEEQVIIDSNSNLFLRQQQELYQKPLTQEAAPEQPEKEYVLTIDGIEVDPKNLKSINHMGTGYKIYCPESALNKAGDFRGQFEKALSENNDFAKAKGTNGIKSLGNGKYEIKTNTAARILGIEAQFTNEEGQAVKIIHFSKYLQNAKKGTGGVSEAFKKILKDLTAPAISYKEKDPSASPSDPEGSANPLAAAKKDHQI